MAGKIIEWFKTRSLSQAMFLSFINSTIWVWGYSLFLYGRFHGGIDGNSGSGSGLLDLLFAWMFAMGTSWIVSRQLCRRWYGYANKTGFIFSVIFTLPIYFFSALIVTRGTFESTLNGLVLKKIFYFIGLFGILPEGRFNAATHNAACFVSIFIVSVFGYYFSTQKIKKIFLVLLCFGFSSVVPTNIYSYDIVRTHPLITARAISLLNSKSTVPYPEIVNKAELILDGAVDEDTFPHWRNHFYRPTDGKGLGGINANALKRLSGQDYLGENFLEEVLELYKHNNKEDAYKKLGHILHLASQDMFAAPHVFDDPHLIISNDISVLNYAPNSFEPWVQNNTEKISTSPFSEGHNIPFVSWPPTIALHENAAATYKLLRASGTLNTDMANPASGAIKTMFPGIIYTDECNWDDSPEECSSRFRYWTLPNYEKCYMATGLVGNPGGDDHWWLAQNFTNNSDKEENEDNTQYFYFENPSHLYPDRYKDGDPANGKTLSELWALDKGGLIAKAVEASAGILSAFAQTVDQVKPTIELRQNDYQGAIIHPNGFAGNTVYVKAQDPGADDVGGDPNYPVPSGIYKVELKNTDTGAVTEPEPGVPPGGLNIVPIILNNLVNGKYLLTAYDGLGNSTSVNFKVLAASTFTVLDAEQKAIPDSGFAATDIVYVTGGPNTAKITMDGLYNHFEDVFAEGENPVSEFGYIGDGVYTVSAYDADNNPLNSISFTNDRTAPYVYMTDSSGRVVDVTTQTVLTAHAVESGPSGLDRVVLDNGAESYGFNGESEAEKTLPELSLGQHSFTVYDRSGNSSERRILILAPDNPSYGNSPYILEKTVTVPGSGPVRFVRALPDGSYYVTSDGGIKGAETDGDGNVYTMSDGYLSKRGPTASRSVTLGGYDCEFGKHRNIPPVLAIDRTNKFVYAVSCNNDDYMWGGHPELRISVFDTNLNLLHYDVNPTRFSTFGGIFVDTNSTVWVEGIVFPEGYLTGAVGPPAIQVRNYGPGLSGGTGQSIDLDIFNGYSDEDAQAAAGDPRGGVVVITRNTVFHIGTVSGGIALAHVNKDWTGEPMVVDYNSNLYGWDATNDSTIMVAPDNSFIYSIPSFQAASIPDAGILDLAESDGTNINISRYRLGVDARSQDGVADFRSIMPGASVEAPPAGAQTAALAALSEQNLLAVTGLYRIAAGPGAFEPSAELSFTYSAAVLASLGVNSWDVSVWGYSTDTGWTQPDEQYNDGTSQTGATIYQNAEFFAALAQTFSYAYSPDGVGAFYSSDPNAVVAAPPAEAQAAILAAAASQGLAPATPQYKITTYPGVFKSYAELGVTYSTSALAGLGAAPEDLAVYEYSAGSGWTKLAIQYLSPEWNWAGAQLSGNADYFGFFVPARNTALPIVPSSGPIGVPFTITGEGFGAYSSGITVTLIGGTTAPLTLWSTTTIKGTVPGGLAPGEYPVLVKRGTTTIANVEPFTVTAPALDSIMPSSGAIGVPFVLTGESFGNYVANYTKVLIGGATAPLTLWTDTKIQGTVPGALDMGDHDVVVERAINGGVVRISSATFTLVTPSVTGVTPSSGAIGVPFIITGANFGNYVASYTKVLIGGATAPLTLWTDTKIQGTIPGPLNPGDYNIVVERALNGGIVDTEPAQFKVIAPSLFSIIPSSGSIGIGFTLMGANFGNYVANYTRVLIGGATAPLTLWTDSKIQGTVPGLLASGTYDVAVERELNGGLVRTSTVAFTLVIPSIASVIPSSGAIGVPFTITGANFGNYVANYTVVLIGGATAPLTLWNDTKIQGTIPGVSPGDYDLVVQRELNGGVVTTLPAQFKVIVPTLTGLTPSTGTIGATFTLTGTDFGNYVANYTRVLIGGATAPLTLWSDTKIQGTIPGLAAGDYPVLVERAINGGAVQTSTLALTVAAPYLGTISPSSGTIGVLFTLTGSNFGNYISGYTNVLIGGATAPLTLWSDTKIQGTIPGGFGTGQYTVTAERRTADGIVARSNALSFAAVGINVSSITPVAGPIGLPFTLYGSNFGNYVANYTKVLIGGATAPLTLWTDTKIQGSIPGALVEGDYPVVVERTMNGGQVQSSTLTWTTATPSLASVNPSSGAIGIQFALSGANFGNYVANYTKVLIGGATTPLTLWTDTQIQGTIPGTLPPGDYALYLERALNGGVVRTSTITFTVAAPVLIAVSPSTAAVIAPFTLTGSGFGNYVANYTKVVVNGLAAPLTLWSETKIQGKLPFLPAGNYPLQVQRYFNGGLGESATAYISVAGPFISSMTPLSGSGGTAFTINGSNFGPYDSSLVNGKPSTRVTVDGTVCSLSLWSDVQIKGLISDSIIYGTHTVLVERAASGGTASSNAVQFTKPGGGYEVSSISSFAKTKTVPAAGEHKAELPLSPDWGGTVESPARSAVTVPKNALAEETVITISPDNPSSEESARRERAGKRELLAAVGAAVSFGPEGLIFGHDAELKLPYDIDKLPTGKGVSDLAVYWWDDKNSEWVMLPSEPEQMPARLKAKTGHFSVYQVMASGVAILLADPAFKAGEHYAYPNPTKGNNPKFHFECGLADSARLSVYDISGHKVYEADMGAAVVLGSKYAYEKTWDVGNAASGVYVYILRANKVGFSDIVKKGKVAVIR